jgi:hypothetical protein
MTERASPVAERGEEPAMPEALRELRRHFGVALNTAVLGDILDEMGFRRQFLPPAIRPLAPDMMLAGLAMPVLETDVADAAEPFGRMFEALDSLRARSIWRRADRWRMPCGAS